MAVRWKLAYPLSYRNIEEMMSERAVKLDHSTVQKWVAYYAAQLEREFRTRKCKVGNSWRTYKCSIEPQYNYRSTAVSIIKGRIYLY